MQRELEDAAKDMKGLSPDALLRDCGGLPNFSSNPIPVKTFLNFVSTRLLAKFVGTVDNRIVLDEAYEDLESFIIRFVIVRVCQHFQPDVSRRTRCSRSFMYVRDL